MEHARLHKRGVLVQRHFSSLLETGSSNLGSEHGMDLDSHAKFRTRYESNFPLLSDPGHKVSDEYGVYKLKNNYGKDYWGIERSTFIINKE